jgi:hypothetical protein
MCPTTHGFLFCIYIEAYGAAGGTADLSGGAGGFADLLGGAGGTADLSGGAGCIADLFGDAGTNGVDSLVLLHR